MPRNLKFSNFLMIKLLLVAIFYQTILNNNVLFSEERKELMFMCGAAAAPVAELLVKEFEEKYNIKVNLTTGGSGFLLSQIKLTKKGDVYFAGSIDFIEMAKEQGLIHTDTITPVVYLVPAINVQKGNPHNIRSFKDLTKPGLKVAIANPETVCLGVFAVEMIEKLLTKEEKEALIKNLVNYTESCEKTATAISMKSVDAVLGWSVFQHWDPEKIETVKLPPNEIFRISYLAAAATIYAKDLDLAKKFLHYMKTDGLKHFKKFNYFISPQEAIEYVGEEKPIGGEAYKVSQEWLNHKK